MDVPCDVIESSKVQCCILMGQGVNAESLKRRFSSLVLIQFLNIACKNGGDDHDWYLLCWGCKDNLSLTFFESPSSICLRNSMNSTQDYTNKKRTDLYISSLLPQSLS